MDISRPVTKKDHALKMSGGAMYVADFHADGMLSGKILRSAHAKARVKRVDLPELPDGYFYVDETDVPGENNVHIVLDDTPVFTREAEYIGDPIGMLVGPDGRETERLLGQIKVEYEKLEPVIDIRDYDTVFFDVRYDKGDTETAFAQADKIYEETFETGYQEQAYLETQGMIAQLEDGKMVVTGSMQCPYYIHGALAKVLGFEKDNVRVKMATTGGGFGGKEDYPSILACQAAVAAHKAGGKPVRVVFSRREDMEFTGKRHPSLCKYKVAVKDGKVTGMDIDILYNAGAYTTLSLVVLQRGCICASGVYNAPNLKVRGKAVKTNTVPSGAFRGFGGPQTFFAVEMMMGHIAKDLGRDSIDFKLDNLVKQGDATSTGGRYHFPVPLAEMISDVDKAANLREKRVRYKNQTGRYRRGIGASMIFHGAGFTGSGERDLIKAVVGLRKYPDGGVEILSAGADIGQGLKTTLCKIVSKELNIPLDMVIFDDPDTGRVPDSGPTVASRSLMVVGELLRRAAIKLREQWRDGEEQTVEERFIQPDFVIPFDPEKFEGDAYPDYSWGAYAVEVEIDTLTGQINLLGAWGDFDVGTVIDENIVRGQMEGGLLQGIGYASMEYMTADWTGRIRNNSYSDYIIPTSVDAPNLHVMAHTGNYPPGPYGAKGAGELPTVGGAPAYIEAVETALETKINHAPFTAEDVMKVLRAKGGQLNG